MTYEVILFDIDDTLFDFQKSETAALHKTFEAFGLPTGVADYQADYKEISNGLWGKLERGELTLTDLGVERYRQLFQKHALELDAEMFNQAYLRYLGKETHLVPGAVELCTHFENVRLAVITNGYQDVQLSRIANSPLRNVFEQIITSEAAKSQKPHLEIFDYTFSKLGLTDKEKVLIVGDSLTSDIQGGINYGIDTCWFNPNKKANTLGSEPIYEIHALTELIDLVKTKEAVKGSV